MEKIKIKEREREREKFYRQGYLNIMSMLIFYENRGPKCRVLVKNKGNFEAEEKRREENAWVSVI